MRRGCDDCGAGRRDGGAVTEGRRGRDGRTVRVMLSILGVVLGDLLAGSGEGRRCRRRLAPSAALTTRLVRRSEANNDARR